MFSRRMILASRFGANVFMHRYSAGATLVAVGTVAAVALTGLGSLTAAQEEQHHQYPATSILLTAGSSSPRSSKTTYCDAAASSTETSDRLASWQKRWDQGKTRWHRTQVNSSLAKYLESHLLGDGCDEDASRRESTLKKKSILVPLAGKTVDMAYLARHKGISEVIGVEGIKKACEEFSAEHPDLELQESGSSSPSQSFTIFTGRSIVLLQGDFFHLNRTQAEAKVDLMKVDAVWDRGALVAIDPSLRGEYVGVVRQRLNPGGRILLSTYVKHSGDKMKGPPFSIDENDVHQLYGSQPWVQSIELLERKAAAQNEPWYARLFLWIRMGKTEELVFLITAKE